MAGPMKKERVSPNGKTRLLNFLRHLLADPSYMYMITWTDKDNQEFRMIKPHEVAAEWGKVTNNYTMNYDKMSRGLRYFYQDGTLKKLPGKDSKYQFLDGKPNSSSPSSSSSSSSSSPTTTAAPLPIPQFMMLPSFTGFPMPGTPLPNFGLQMRLASVSTSTPSRTAPTTSGAPSHSIDTILGNNSDSSTTSSPVSSQATSSTTSGSTPSPPSAASTSGATSSGAQYMNPYNPVVAQIMINFLMTQNPQIFQNPQNNQ